MKRYIFFLLVIAFCSSIYAQEYRWKAELNYFFDNTEYEKSPFIDSETMNGIWLNPMGSIVWDNKHSINAGVNLLKIPGMNKAIDKVDVTAYYEYKSPKILFRAGSFPRSEVLGNYNNFFFKDSINNFVPLMQGVFWQIGNDKIFFNAWFDRTGYATPTKHEHFFVGLSGKVSKGLFFADFQSYMFHFSNTKPATPGEGVSENLQLQATAGLEYKKEDGFKGLFAIGTLMGYERDRRFKSELYKPIGFVARGDGEMWGIGTKNTLYVGDARMRLAKTFGGNLYWGTQFLQAKSYLESEWYIRLIESDFVKARFNCNLHLTQGNVLFQQMLTVSASIDNFSPKNGKGIVFPWMRIFE
ncbi:MAG: hypothetical protein Q4G63_11250 [Bacteroidia bacterium]|nr:hypothetical protein [Bacteroidia bacterium]